MAYEILFDFKTQFPFVEFNTFLDRIHNLLIKILVNFANNSHMLTTRPRNHAARHKKGHQLL